MTAETRKPKRTRIGKWMAGGAIFLCFVLSTIFIREKPSLQKQSTLTADIHNSWIAPYHWLSDHQILFARLGSQNGLYCYDTRTRQERFLKLVSRKLEKAIFLLCLDSLRVSPDGTRLIWIELGEETVYGAWLDGSHCFTCVPRRNDGNGPVAKVRWTSDSRHWVAFVSDRHGTTQAILYDVDASHKPTIKATAASDKSDPLETMGFGTQSLVLNDHILAGERFADTPAIPAKIVDIGLGIPNIRLKTRSIFLGPDTNIHEMAFSEQGDRIALLSTTERLPSWAPLLHRLLPHIPIKPQRVETLRVGRVDGTLIHEIGSRNLERKEGFEPQLNHLKWMPDGTRLSYIYKSGLYTVAAK